MRQRSVYLAAGLAVLACVWIGAARPGPAVCHGDANGDGQINMNDVNPFVLALVDIEEWQRRYPNVPVGNVDVNGDGLVNFDDINPMVVLLLYGEGACQ